VQLSLVPTFVGQSFHDAAAYMHEVAEVAPSSTPPQTLDALSSSAMWVQQGISDLTGARTPKAGEAIAIGNQVLAGISQLAASISEKPSSARTDATVDAIDALADLTESACELVRAPGPHKL
jgi:hypothetical protein